VRKEEVSWTFMPAHEKPPEKVKADKLRAEKPKAAKPAGKAAKAGKGAEKDDEDGDELTAEDLDVLYYDDFVVPFDPLIEEQLQLELPLKELCRVDCRGLCPQCGSDRNAAPCDCTPPLDERWKTLKTILETDDKN
jgi:hypothetical protein